MRGESCCHHCKFIFFFLFNTLVLSWDQSKKKQQQQKLRETLMYLCVVCMNVYFLCSEKSKSSETYSNAQFPFVLKVLILWSTKKNNWNIEQEMEWIAIQIKTELWIHEHKSSVLYDYVLFTLLNTQSDITSAFQTCVPSM